MTILSGGHTSPVSFAKSIAIFAAPYAILQADSLDGPGSLSVVPVGSQDGEVIDRAVALDGAAGALWSLSRGSILANPCFMYSVSDGMGENGGLFGVATDDELF